MRTGTLPTVAINISTPLNIANSCVFNCSDTETETEAETIRDIFIVTSLVVTTVIGVIGNALVCVVVKHFTRRSSMDFYIMVLAIADLGILLIIVPLLLFRLQMSSHWPLGRVMCEYFYPIQDTFYGVSIWTIVTIAVERRRSIVNLADGFRGRSMKSSRLIILVVCAVNFCIFSLPLFFMMDYTTVGTSEYCSVVWPKWAKISGHSNIFLQAHTALIVLVGYVIPLVIIVWTYESIVKHLEKSSIFLMMIPAESPRGSKDIISETNRNERRRLEQNNKAKRLLTPVVIVFAVTMLPLDILRFVVLYMKVPAEYYKVIFPLTCILVIINSAVNPLVYSITNNRFRTGLREIFCRSQVRLRKEKGVFTCETFGKTLV